RRVHLQAAQEARQRVERQELYRDRLGPRLCAARAVGRRGENPGLRNSLKAVAFLLTGHFRAPAQRPGLLFCSAAQWSHPIPGLRACALAACRRIISGKIADGSASSTTLRAARMEAGTLGPGSADEAEELSRLIGHIYDAALDPDRWLDVLARAATFCNTATATIGSFDFVHQKSNITKHWGYDPHHFQILIDKNRKLHPLPS